VQRRAGALEPTVGKDSGRAAVDFWKKRMEILI
jgi:hypothetical protein